MPGPRRTSPPAGPLLALVLAMSFAARPAACADPAPAASSDEKRDPPPSAPVRTAAKVTIVVGGVMILGGFVPALLGLGKKSKLDAACPSKQCPSDQAGQIDTLRAYETQTNVLWVSGLVVAAVGVGLYLWGPGRDEAPTRPSPYRETPPPARSSLRLVPSAAAGGGGLLAVGTF